MPAEGQESRLKNKAQADREEIEPHRAKHSRTQLDDGVYNSGEKTNCRSNEKITVHRAPYFRLPSPLGNSAIVPITLSGQH
jgi:hypothetical protein